MQLWVRVLEEVVAAFIACSGKHGWVFVCDVIKVVDAAEATLLGQSRCILMLLWFFLVIWYD